MHAAPPVRVRVRRGAAWPAFVATLAAAAAGNVTAWVLQALEWHAAWPVACVAALVAAGAAVRWAQRLSGEGELSWDGVQWHWQGRPAQAQAAIDLGDWMLLRLTHVAVAPSWIAAGRAATDGPWGALRAALHAARPPEGFDAAPPPA